MPAGIGNTSHQMLVFVKGVDAAAHGFQVVSSFGFTQHCPGCSVGCVVRHHVERDDLALGVPQRHAFLPSSGARGSKTSVTWKGLM